MRPLIASLSFLLSAQLTGCLPPSEDPTPGVVRLPIVGGTASSASFLPGVGALVLTHPWFGSQTFCTATLISDQLVLSAAHCFAEIPSGSAVSFSVGTVGTQGKLAPLASWQIHPQYKGGNPPGGLADWYDIAVGKLKAPTTLATPLKMVRTKEVGSLLKYGAPLLIVGYGKTDPKNDNSSGVKHQGTTELAQIGASEIWIQGQGTPTKCMGDSGGPTLADADASAANDWRIIGVASRADQDCSYGSVETRVDPYLSWIHGFGTIPCGSGLSADCGVTPPPPPPPVKKEIGQTCAAASDCKGNLCIPTTAGQPMVCSQLCAPAAAGSCPSGYHCVPIVGKTDGACVRDVAVPPPAKKTLGEGCALSSECQSGICASTGDQSYCTELCVPEAGCGLESMECVPAGDSKFACAPKLEEPLDGGGGGCALASGTTPPPMLLSLLSLLAIALLARRRR